MVNFRKSRKPRNFLARREQGRLLFMVMLLGVVMYMMGVVGQPENWQQWLRALGMGQDGQQAVATSADAPPQNGPTRPARHGEQAPVPAGRFFPGVDAELLKSVRDDTSGKEPEAWFHLFEVLESTDQTTLEEHSIGQVDYTQLYKQPGEFRGELVTVRGSVRRACPAYPGPDAGLAKYYQLTLKPEDDVARPIFVYTRYLPEGFPMGMDMSANVEITGFFFKRWLYPAGDIQRTAPLMAARTVRWRKTPPPVPTSPPGPGTVLLVIALAAVVGLAVATYVYRRTQPGRSDEDVAPPDFDALRETVPPSEVGLPLEKPDKQT